MLHNKPLRVGYHVLFEQLIGLDHYVIRVTVLVRGAAAQGQIITVRLGFNVHCMYDYDLTCVSRSEPALHQ